MDQQAIIKRAERFCRENDVTHFPVDVYALCKKQGISVANIPLPPEVSGFIVIQEEPFQSYRTGRLIACNRNEPAARRRFTIAHELAHYVLHRQADAPIYAHRDAGQGGGIEAEADLFAANLLMPESEFRGSASVMRGYPFERKCEALALRFCVSRAAARVRMEQLHIG